MAAATNAVMHVQPQPAAVSLHEAIMAVHQHLAKNAAAATASKARLARADELPTDKLEERPCALSAYKHAIGKIVERLGGTAGHTPP